MIISDDIHFQDDASCRTDPEHFRIKIFVMNNSPSLVTESQGGHTSRIPQPKQARGKTLATCNLATNC